LALLILFPNSDHH